MYPREAADTLGQLDSVRRSSRRALGRPWFPMLCFGVVTAASAPLIAAVGTIALVPFWVVGGVVGMSLVRAHYAQRAIAEGVTARGGRMWVIAVTMFVVCLVAGFVAGRLWGAAAGLGAPMIAVLVGYLLLGWVQRNVLPAVLVLGCTAVGLSVALARAQPWLVELTFGCALILGGTLLLALERRQVADRRVAVVSA